ncbi:MAG: hypothetical protein RL750_554 [Bacteroidota bacterium]
MSLEKNIMAELKTAMLNKDEAALRSLRAIKAAILVAKTAEGAPAELDEAAEIKLLQKMVKQRKDSLEIFTQQNRAELAAKEAEEIAVIERFLPKPLSEAELIDGLKQILAETGANSPADMGKVMGAANKAFAGKVDGKTLSALVKQLLTNQGA